MKLIWIRARGVESQLAGENENELSICIYSNLFMSCQLCQINIDAPTELKIFVLVRLIRMIYWGSNWDETIRHSCFVHLVRPRSYEWENVVSCLNGLVITLYPKVCMIRVPFSTPFLGSPRTSNHLVWFHPNILCPREEKKRLWHYNKASRAG